MLSKREAYAKWLGLREQAFPLNHYRQLGIVDFEADPEVISNAADSRMSFVRQFHRGENAAVAADILNELAQARVTLLNAQRKAQYDASLRHVHQANRPSPPVPPVIAPPASATAASAVFVPAVDTRRAGRRRSRGPMVVAIGLLLVCAGFVAYAAMYGPGSPWANRHAQPDETAEPKEVTTAPAPPVAVGASEAATAPAEEPEPPAAATPPRAERRVPRRRTATAPIVVKPANIAPAAAAATVAEQPSAAPPDLAPTAEPPESTPTEVAPAVDLPSAGAVKLPVPDEAAQQAAMKLVTDVYGKDYKETKGGPEQTALAREMLRIAAESDEPTSRFVLLRVARDVAAGAGDAELAFRAIEQRGETWAIDVRQETHEALEKAVRSADAPAQHETIVALAAELQDQAVEADDLVRAAQYGEWASTAARGAKKPDLSKLFVARGRELAALTTAYAEVQPALARLDESPDDPQANLAAGRYFTLIKGDWDRGLPMLARGTDEQLKRLAELEQSSSPQPLVLGDGWWDVAQREQDRAKQNSLDRAGYWYLEGLSDASGLAKLKVEQRLDKISEASEGHEGGLMSATADEEIRRLLAGGGDDRKPGDSAKDAEEARRRELVSKLNVQKRQANISNIKQRQADNNAAMKSFRNRYGLKVR